MHFLRTTALAAAAALALAGAAGAEPLFGVSDDRGKYDDDGGAWFFSELTAAGLTANKMTVNWDPAHPLEIREKAFLDRAIPEAEARGVHISFGIHIGKARAITGSPRAINRFVAWLQLLARTYPQVTEYVVGNEPNLTRFWQPQFDRRGRGVSGIAFAAFLARSYDALKDVNPNITVVGVGLSPRGNDMPRAKSNVSTSPVKFIRDLGIGYGRMARNKPLMDVFGFHPYPARDRDTLAKGYRWPNAGIANLDRIKQAFWDAFHDTAQPTFLEGLPPAPEPQPEPAPAPPPAPPVEPPPPASPAPPVEPIPPTPPLEPRDPNVDPPPSPLLGADEPPPPVEPPPQPPPPGVPPVEPTPPPEPDPEPEEKPEPLTFKLDEVGWQVAIPRRSRRAYYGRESIKPTDERTQSRIYGQLVRKIACDPSVRALLFFGLIDEPNLDRWQAGLVRADRTRRPSWGVVRSAVRQGCRGPLTVWRHTEKVIGASVRRTPGRVVVRAEEDATVRVARSTFRLRAYRPRTVRVTGRPLVEFSAAMNPERRSLFR